MEKTSVKKLNKEQLRAIRHGKGPLLIIAGAGTGKTTVITERIKYLITSGLAKPSEILALTFTDKASREMQERVDIAMPYGYTQMWISTFHSFCDRILRAEALHIGLDPKFKLMSVAETTKLIRDNLFKFDLNYFRPLGNPTKFISGMVKHLSRLQDEDISPSDYTQWVKDQRLKMKRQKGKAKIKGEDLELEISKWEELAGAFRVYEELKVKGGLMDYGDLIVKTLKLFRERKNVLREYRKKFKYFLIDEFQDTNFSQNELAILLAGRGKNANITVTGDDDQSIYRFRGAAVSNIIHFRKTYPKAKIVVLMKNYRSTQIILDRAYDLIQNNNPDRLEVVEKVDKKLISVRDKKGKDVVFFHEDRVENEAERVAKEVKELVTPNKENGNYQFKDIAILVRANNHSESFIRAFQRHNIPYQFLGPGRLFKQNEVLDLISYLKVLYNPDDSLSFYRLLSMDEFKISGLDLVRISGFAKKFNLSFYEAVRKIDKINVSKSTKKTVKKLIKTIKKHLDLSKKETAGQILYYFLEKFDLLAKLLSPSSSDAEKRAANISKFFDRLKTYEVDHEDARIPSVVDWIDLSRELGESPLASDLDWTEINAVNILTVHSSKGLEFPVVFLVNLVSQRFPSTERSEQIPIPEDLIKEILPKGDYHEQEERRLFYVGMTRARDRLYFTAADYYGEGKREKKLSLFIPEALGSIKSVERKDVEQLSFLSYGHSQEIIKSKRPPKIKIDYLSYSQINTFKTCPRYYKLKYILKIPTSPTAALSFGSSMHATMRDFYSQIKKGEKSSIKLILGLLNKNWIDEGYSTKAHERKMRSRGEIYLKEYLKKEFDSGNLPVALEEDFTVPLILPRKKPLRIGGRMDRVDINRDGTLEIIDYKTGERIPSQRDVDKDLQLTFYALAAASIREKPFGRSPEEIKLSLYYFDKQERISTKRNQKQLEDAVKEIFDWRKKIENSDFECANSYMCKNCEYKSLCGS